MQSPPARTFFGTLIQLCLVRGKPQDLPASPQLLAMTMGAYIVTNLIPSFGTGQFGKLVLIAVVEALATLAVLWVFLRVAQKAPRLVQAGTALFGAIALAQLVTAPFTTGFASSLQTESGTLAIGPDAPLIPLVLLLLFGIWMIAIMANVIRHTFETTLFKAVLLSFGLKLLAMFFVSVLLAPTSMTPAPTSS